MSQYFITNVQNDGALGLPSTMGDAIYPAQHNSSYDDFEVEDAVIENSDDSDDEGVLPLPSTFDEDTDYSMQGEAGSGEETPLPMPSTAPERGRF